MNLWNKSSLRPAIRIATIQRNSIFKARARKTIYARSFSHGVQNRSYRVSATGPREITISDELGNTYRLSVDTPSIRRLKLTFEQLQFLAEVRSLFQHTERRQNVIGVRDHCQCPTCVHPDTKQRQLDTFTVRTSPWRAYSIHSLTVVIS